MKPKQNHPPTRFLPDSHKCRRLAVGSALFLSLSAARAADVTKLSTGGLSTAASWDGGALPGSANTALFDSSTVAGSGGATFDASGAASLLTLGSMKVTDIQGVLNFTNVATVTVGALGGTIVDLSSAGANVTFDSGTLRLSTTATAAGGSLSVAAGRTLTVNNLSNNSGTRTYTLTGGGDVVVNGGTFLSGGAASAIINNANLTLNGGGTSLLTGSVTLQSGSLNFGNDSALGTKDIIATGGAITASSGTRTIGNGFNLSNTVTFGGSNDLTVTGVIAGAGALAKSGTGTLTLGVTNTYLGTTAVNEGTLVINGSTASGGAVSVASGAILGGSGTVGGATTISGTHDAGSSATGVQKFSANLSYGSTSMFEWDLAGSATGTRETGYDGVNVGGALAGVSGATFKINLNSGAFTETFWETNRIWSDIFKSNVDGSGSALDIASVFSNIVWYQGTTDMTGSTATKGAFALSGSSLTWTAVPEPTNALVGLLTTAGLLRRRRHA